MLAQPSLPHSLFTTDLLPEKERFSAWREDMSVIFDVNASPVQDEKPFHATFDLYHCGQSVLASLTASTGRYVRTKRKAARDGLDSVLIQLFLEGGVQFGVGTRTTYAQAGDIVIFDLSQPVDNVNTEFRHITAMWPRTAIEEVLPDIARWHGHVLPPTSPAVALLRQHLVACYELMPRFTMDEGRRVEAATVALVTAAMAGGKIPAEDDSAPLAEVLTYQIKRYIREHLGAADLSPAQIAQHFGISRTRLYQLFEPLGGIARHQRHLRLQRCLEDLQDPTEARLHISEIAYRWGFNHPATFNRNFRQAFGMTPSEARAQAIVGVITSAFTLAPFRREERLKREHHQWFHAIAAV